MPRTPRFSPYEISSRKATASHIKGIRRIDRGFALTDRALGRRVFGSAWVHEHTFRDYELGLLGPKYRGIDPIIEERLKRKKSLAVLDIGCHYGYFLAELGKRFGDRLDLEGITLARPLRPEQVNELIYAEVKASGPNLADSEARDMANTLIESQNFHDAIKRFNIKVHVGQAEKHQYGRRFDLIFSMTAIIHSRKPRRLLVNTLNYLKVGGEAFLEFGVKDFIKGDEGVQEELRRQGIEIEEQWEGVYRFKRLGKNPIKLKEVEN
ncbi:MAG: methyltransferase domain-containing protein [Candidatus Diapherotrites archaeon]|nr:methyltransferase domain-containing protein [Candidatus Diapherotrites archaeon]